MEQKQEFAKFSYMIAPQNSGNTQLNLAQIGDDGNKTIQYIAQPFTTSYGQSYTLVNPVQLSGQNGQIVINKPNMTVRTILQLLLLPKLKFSFSLPF